MQINTLNTIRAAGVINANAKMPAFTKEAATVTGFQPLAGDIAANVVGRVDGQQEPVPTRIVSLDSSAGHGIVGEAAAYLSDQGIAAEQFSAHQITADSLGMHHVRMNRAIDGVPVYGEQVIVHIRPGTVDDRYTVTGNTADLVIEQSTKLISSREAVKIALESTGAEGKVSVAPCFFKNVEAGAYVRGFRVDIEGEDEHGGPVKMTCFVNGATASVQDSFTHVMGIWKQRDIEIIDSESRQEIAPAQRSSDPEADDKTMYSGYVKLDTTKKGDEYTLRDESRGKYVETRDAKNGYSGSRAIDMKDGNNVWGEASDVAKNQAGVDAHYGAQMTYDTLLNIIGVDSIDLKGHQLVSNVHIRRNYVNAYWDGSAMNYGDGDGRTASSLTTLDIAGHEIAHGLTENTAGLIYRNESGGLNESFSDIAGFLVEWYAAKSNPAVKWDWTMGEDCWTPTNGNPNDGLRYLDDPTSDGYSVDHYSKYPEQTEVHGSSGICNAAFYQLAETDEANKNANSISGVVVKDALGVETAAKIFFRALIHYMTPRTTFAQARTACIQAAVDLHGADSTEVGKVKEAWSSAGVEENNTVDASRYLV